MTPDWWCETLFGPMPDSPDALKFAEGAGFTL